MRENPYSGLAGSAFWKSAVAELDLGNVESFAHSKKRIARRDAVATGGSCFAQHISRRLRMHGFNYLDVESAPEQLRPEHRAKFGYELYSARYGNIYTSLQLRQLVARMLGQFEPREAVWKTDGRFYDPFRPSIEPNGFVSEAEVLDGQKSHLDAVKRMFQAADVFIFTLGLTEAWRSKEDGAVYPTCPGTQAGSFDAAKYEFVNLSMAEVLADLRDVFDALKAINPRIRFVLTVSPVPLTATASGKHVVSATTYSKAVLRAAAGQLADELPSVDYFPSYDLITSPIFGGSFFDDNKRTIRDAGVDLVMRCFLKDFCEGPGVEETAQPTPADRRKTGKSDALDFNPLEALSGPQHDEESIQRANGRRVTRHRKRQKDIEQALCDEEMLDLYRR